MVSCHCYIKDYKKNSITLLKPSIKKYISKYTSFSAKQRRFINRLDKNDLFLFVNLRNKYSEPYEYNYLTKKQLLNSLRFPVVYKND